MKKQKNNTQATILWFVYHLLVFSYFQSICEAKCKFVRMRSNCLWLENERIKLIYYLDCAFFDGVIAALIRFVAQCRRGHSGLLFHPIEYWVAHFHLYLAVH